MNPPLHILLVDDEQAHVELIRLAFARDWPQASLVCAATLADARKRLAAAPPELAIIDLMLPDGRGIELLAIDDDSGLTRFPVVIMTSQGDEEQAVRAMKCGAMDYVVKNDHSLREMPRMAVRVLREWSHLIERRHAERRLGTALAEVEAARQRLDNILCSMADALLVTDRTGRVLLCNPPAGELLALDCSAAVGTSLATLAGGDTLAKELGELLADDSGASRECELTIEGAGAPSAYWRSRMSRMQDPGGAVAGAVILLRNISREKELERMKSEFLSTAAHELRTPLSAILGYAELLLNDLGTGAFTAEQQESFLRIICERGDALEQIISELLDINRIQSGHAVRLNYGPVEIKALLLGVVERFRLQAPAHRVTCTIPGEAPASIAGDFNRLTQVVENLLHNAVKFSPKGSEVHIAVASRAEAVDVSVRDEGVGMDPETAAQAFDCFYRADASNTARGGLGLGLGLCRHIVEAHGGSIRLESALREGTTVTFTLPVAAAARRPGDPS